MTSALLSQAFMTKVTTTCRDDLHSLSTVTLRVEGDPGEPYPLQNFPFPIGPGNHHLRKVVPQIASAIGVPMSYGGPNPLEVDRSRKVVPELRMARLGACLLQNRVFYSTCEHESLNPIVFIRFRANARM